MHSFQNFIVRLIPSHPPSLETRIWKFVVRALDLTSHRFALSYLDFEGRMQSAVFTLDIYIGLTWSLVLYLDFGTWLGPVAKFSSTH